MKILVTGATGLIGRRLLHVLLKQRHHVLALARSPEKLPELPENNVFSWSDHQIVPLDALKNCDAVIHLAGEGIADQRWSDERKKRIWDSRVAGTKNLIKSIGLLDHHQRPRLLISGSAIGYYGQSDQPQDETSKRGDGFLSNLCAEWEWAAQDSENDGLRTVLIRTGLVLANESGVLAKTGPVVLGNGRQWMSWIHIEDIIRFILFALENKNLSGSYNLTAPHPVTNKEFTTAVAQFSSIPLTISVPQFALKLILGEMSEIVLANQKVIPTKTLASGFRFIYSQLDTALNNLLSGSSMTNHVFSTKQFVPAERVQIFSFFSKAENLEILTPPWLNFQIQKKSTPEIQKGSLIDYQLKIHGVPVRWRTVIREWNPDESFVDFQLKGPYRKWHHLHTFDDVQGGTLISDEVNFVIPGWIFGNLFLPLIKKDVNEIFKYRQKKIKELYTVGTTQ